METPALRDASRNMRSALLRTWIHATCPLEVPRREGRAQCRFAVRRSRPRKRPRSTIAGPETDSLREGGPGHAPQACLAPTSEGRQTRGCSSRPAPGPRRGLNPPYQGGPVPPRGRRVRPGKGKRGLL
eukprot:scaffold1621_cov150-Pinguiococcus_pyrenoidosus.AAC.12